MTARCDLAIPLPTSVREARAAGVSEHRLRATDLLAPLHGIRLKRGDEVDLRAVCRGLMTKMRPGDAFTGPTAARLWGIPIPVRLAQDHRLHVSSMLPVRPLRRRGVVGSLREPSAFDGLEGIPVLSPLRTWFSLAVHLSTDDLVAAADFVITGDRGRGPLVSREELILFAAGMARHPGAPRARAAAAASRVGAWSRPESLVRLLAIRVGLPEPVLNAPLRTLDRRVLIPDLCWPDVRMALEYNGAVHELDAQHRRDLRRLDDYADLGWRVVNVDRTELFGAPVALEARLRRVHAQCAESARQTVDD